MFQLGSALLDACVLAVLSKGDAYGYSLTQNIRSVIEVSESTLYPVLRRLQKDQMLTTYDQPFNGRNRRYYQIAPLGRAHLEFLQNNWLQFKAAVESLLWAPVPAPSFTHEATATPSKPFEPSASGKEPPPPQGEPLVPQGELLPPQGEPLAPQEKPALLQGVMPPPQGEPLLYALDAPLPYCGTSPSKPNCETGTAKTTDGTGAPNPQPAFRPEEGGMS